MTVVGTVEDGEPEETKNFDVRSQQREQNGITTEPGCGDFHLGRQVTWAGRLVPAILPKVDGYSRGARSCRDPAYLLCISADLDMHISSPMHRLCPDTSEFHIHSHRTRSDGLLLKAG